ncbi:16863_t:CDS:2 [Acaulospora morrowiae]|uniref:16863_t:CDS:1 n=1 Tax=Acaulospora morrowiae TaxID=94023 RepID=A0A9N9FLH7_9GLOM|nr:16863_t:CDS:2 [Acaulospora morrowiae]
MINGQHEVNIPGLDIYCEVDGNKPSDINLLEMLHSHEKEIIEILPPSAIGVGITFEDSSKDPLIIIYVEKLPFELSEQTIEDFFKILQRPPEEIIICGENGSHKQDCRANENNRDKDVNNGIFEVEKNESNEDNNEPSSSTSNGKNRDGSFVDENGESNGNEENDFNMGHGDNKDDHRKDSGFKKKKNEGQENNEGDGNGDHPNDTNTMFPDRAIGVYYYAKITLDDIINQIPEIRFKLKMWHPENKDYWIFEVSDMCLLGGMMLSEKLKAHNGKGYYPVKVNVTLEAHKEVPQNNSISLVVSFYDHAATLNMGREKKIREDTSSVFLTNTDRGITKISWKHDIEKKESSKMPFHNVSFKYADRLVKKFVLNTELTLEYDYPFLRYLLSYFSSGVMILPKKFRFLFSIVIEKKEIPEPDDWKDHIHTKIYRINSRTITFPI